MSDKTTLALGGLQPDELDAISEALERSRVRAAESMPIPDIGKRGAMWIVAAVSALLLLLLTNFTAETYQTYQSIARSSTLMASLYAGVYLVVISGLLLYIGYTVKSYRALKDAFEIQNETAESEGYEQERAVALKILEHYRAHQEGEVRLKAHSLARRVGSNSVHDPFWQVKEEIIDDLDKRATEMIFRSAKEVSLFTAFAPGSALDSMAVLFSSAKLMKRVFHIYGYRTNLFTSLLIIRKILENASLAALVEYADDSVSEVLGESLLSKLSVKIAQGIGNGVLMLRIGNILIQSARPFSPDGTVGTYRQMVRLFLEHIKGRVRNR